MRAINFLVNPKTSLCVKAHYVAYGDATAVDDLLPVKRKPLYHFHSKFSTSKVLLEVEAFGRRKIRPRLDLALDLKQMLGLS